MGTDDSIMAINLFDRIAGKGGFLRSVLVLVGGTAFAHAITTLAMPILTRMYSPVDFSILAIFSSLLSIIAAAACLRFDIAIPIPDRDSDAFSLMTLAIGCAMVCSILAGMIVFFAPSRILEKIGWLSLESYLWLLPIGILLAGSYSVLQNWFVREKEFSLIARSRVVQSTASTGTQISMAMLCTGPIGLLLGYLMNTGLACVVLGYQLLRHNRFRQNINDLNWSSLKKTADDYSRFPKYSTWEALANSAAIQVPIIMIAALAAGPEAGYLLLAMTVIQAPMALLGTAIGQVYLSRAPQEYRDRRLGRFTAEILSGLIKTGVGPLLGVGILSPIVFGPLFGEEWRRAGWLVAWMTPWFIMQYLSSPISMALHVTGHQRTVFFLQVFGLIFRVLAVLVAAELPNGPVSEAYAFSGAVFYLIYLCLTLRCVKYC